MPANPGFNAQQFGPPSGNAQMSPQALSQNQFRAETGNSSTPGSFGANPEKSPMSDGSGPKGGSAMDFSGGNKYLTGLNYGRPGSPPNYGGGPRGGFWQENNSLYRPEFGGRGAYQGGGGYQGAVPDSSHMILSSQGGVVQPQYQGGGLTPQMRGPNPQFGPPMGMQGFYGGNPQLQQLLSALMGGGGFGGGFPQQGGWGGGYGGGMPQNFYRPQWGGGGGFQGGGGIPQWGRGGGGFGPQSPANPQNPPIPQGGGFSPPPPPAAPQQPPPEAIAPWAQTDAWGHPNGQMNWILPLMPGQQGYDPNLPGNGAGGAPPTAQPPTQARPDGRDPTSYVPSPGSPGSGVTRPNRDAGSGGPNRTAVR